MALLVRSRLATGRVSSHNRAVAAQHRTRLLPIGLEDKMPGAPAGPAHLLGFRLDLL